MYFWAYEQYSAIARKLAILWWKCANRRGAYAGAGNAGCAVLYVDIGVREESYIDFNDPVVEEALLQAVAIAFEGLRSDENVPDILIHQVHEYVIEQVEKQLGHQLDVIKARVAPPPKGDLKEKIVLGNPNCYVVRNGHDRIRLEKTEIVSNP